MSGGGFNGSFNVRLHVEHLRLAGMAPVMAEQLSARIEEQLLRLVDAHGAPPLLRGGGALRLDAASVRVGPGWSQGQVAAAIARQLYEQWYGPLGPWADRVPDPGPRMQDSTEETS